MPFYQDINGKTEEGKRTLEGLLRSFTNLGRDEDWLR